MTQPADLYSEPIGGATTPVELTGDQARDLYYVKSPVTGDTRGVTREQAVELISRAGWEPVVEPVAQNLLQRQLLRESTSPYASALYGATRGLTGGLSEFMMPQGNEPGAMVIQALREAHPGAALGGEAFGTVAPFFAGPLKLLSLPGMAEAGGAAATRALGGGAPGIARAIASRALGMGLEGGVQGMAYNAGESAIEDTPLTAQKLGAGFLYGATPGAILGAPLGAAEGILGRYALKGGLVRERILKPGITDQDAMQIAQREFGVPAPGLMDELNANMSGESAELHKLAADPSAIGQDIRRQLMEAPERKKEALARAAVNLNEIRDLDEVAINGIAGRMKAEQVRKWIPSGEAAQADADALLLDAIRADNEADLGKVASREAATVAPGARAQAEPEQVTKLSTQRGLGEPIPEGGGLQERLAANRERALADVEAHNRDFEAQGYEVPPEAPAYARMREEQAARVARDAEAEAARVAEINAKASPRGKRIAKMSDILSRWAEFDAPDAGNVMRNELGAMPGRQRLRERLNYVLGNGGEEGIAAYRKAMAVASEADQMALNKRLLDAGFSPSAARPWKGAAVGVLDQLGEEVDAMLGNAKGVIGKKAGGAGDIRDLLANARAKVMTGDKAQAFIELDYLKKRLGKLAAPGEYLGSDMNVAAMARRQYEDIREMLENPQLWGQKAALAQKDINRIMTQRINRADVFFDKFFVDSGKAHPANPWVRLREATPDSVGKQLDGIINPGDSREYQAFRQHISESRDVLQNLKQHYALSDAERGAIGRWGKAIDDAEEAFRDAVFHSQREAQAAKLFKNQARVIPGWGKWVAGHFLGPAGFFGVAAAEQALNPGGRIYARAVLERTLRQSDSRIASAITKILTGKRIRLEGIGATQLVSKASVSMFSGKDKKKAYAETIKELAKFSDPQAATQHASQAMPFATQTLPSFAPTMGAMTARASQYLLQHAPVQPRWTPQGIVVDQPSDMELHEFEARMRGAFDPMSVFDDVAEGEPVPDVQIEAAEYVAPELMDHARLLLVSAMADGRVELSYAKTVQLSMVMGTSLDPTMDPGYINAQQSMYAASAQSAPMKSRRTGNPDGVNRGYRSLHQSKDDQIEAGVPPT